MKKHSIILHLGPCRTSTTYLFNVLLHNNQLGRSVQMNIPHSQIEFLQWVLAQNLPQDHPHWGSIYMLANNIKEDPSVNRLYNQVNTAHPLGPHRTNPQLKSLVHSWLHRLEKPNTKLSLRGGRLVRTLPTVNPRHHDVTHNSQQDSYWLMDRLNYPHAPAQHQFTMGAHSDALSEHLPIVVFAPTLTNGGMFTQDAQYSVNTTTSTDELISTVPHKQQCLTEFIHSLSECVQQLTIVIGLREPTERCISWLKHLDNFPTSLLPNNINSDSYTEQNSELMRQWIDSQLKLYSDYPILSVLAQTELPHNVKLKTYEHHSVNAHTIFPGISDRLNTTVNKLSSGSKQLNAELNHKWIQLNNNAVEKLRGKGTL